MLLKSHPLFDGWLFVSEALSNRSRSAFTTFQFLLVFD